MKKTILVSALIGCCWISAAAEGFTVKGNIPGMPSGTTVALVAQEGDKNKLAEITATGSDFILTGSVDSPTLCEIRFDLPDEDMGKAFPLMIENTDITVSADGYDSLPPSFYVGSEGLDQERKVRINGGQAQKEYEEYNTSLYPYDKATKEAHFNLYWGDEKNKDAATEKRLEAEFAKASVAQGKARIEFIKAHPDYSISGLLLTQLLDEPFSFTPAELDAFASSIAGMWDKARLARVNSAIGNSRKYPKLNSYTDFAVLDTDGKEVKLSSLLDSNKYTLIDFWASWCGPCRAAIPHVKELHKKYSDKLNVLSVSLDSDEKPWRKAMEKEQMEWKQLWADNERVNGVKDPYQIKGIPFLLVIDPSGKIAFAGHGPDELSDFLSKNL